MPEGVYKKASYVPLQSTFCDTLDVWLDYKRICTSGPRVDRCRLRYLDLETTGLSGGAGTVAFLAGLGRLNDGGLSIEQLLLADYCYEPGFLEALVALIPGDAIIVSYNGRAFDMRLLETRLRMNGMRPREYDQLDLYPPARRLFGGSRGASLKEIEAAVLGIERVEDVPGFQIPDLWLKAIRRGSFHGLDPVVAHHAQDIASLAKLHLAMDGLLSSGAQWPSPYIPSLKRAGLFRILSARGRHSEAQACLRVGADSGDLACIRILARIEAREKRSSVTLRRRAYELSGCIEDGIALAKALEWEERRFGEALALIEDLATQPGCPASLSEQLEKRKKRLRRKEGY